MKGRDRRPLIIAHRGASARAPENTLAAFRAAMALGADGIELDIQMTRDGQIVVIHDETVERTTDGRGRVSELTLAEIRRLDAGSWFNRAYPRRARTEYIGARVPTLSDVLALVGPTPLVLCIELKPLGERGLRMIEATLAAVTDAGMQDRVVYASFDHEMMKQLARLAPGAPTAVLYDPRKMRTRGMAGEIIRRAEDASARWVSLHYSLARPRIVAAVRRAGLGTAVWTVNSGVLSRWLAALGVDALITNRPDTVSQQWPIGSRTHHPVERTD
jgi:glycerophosphoryl diester phosphodiesterase